MKVVGSQTERLAEESNCHSEHCVNVLLLTVVVILFPQQLGHTDIISIYLLLFYTSIDDEIEAHLTYEIYTARRRKYIEHDGTFPYSKTSPILEIRKAH